MSGSSRPDGPAGSPGRIAWPDRPPLQTPLQALDGEEDLRLRGVAQRFTALRAVERFKGKPL